MLSFGSYQRPTDRFLTGEDLLAHLAIDHRDKASLASLLGCLIAIQFPITSSFEALDWRSSSSALASAFGAFELVSGDNAEMIGLYLEEGRLNLRADLPVPIPEQGEARVQVLQAGICNTDLELIEGYYPFRGILGHEFLGVVEEGPAALVGRRVVGEINVSCGRCVTCRKGRRTHCPHRSVLGIKGRDGAFAEYLVLPAGNLIPVPDEVASDVATFVEPLAAALEIQEQVNIDSAKRVLVLGPGKLGQLIARSLRLTGCDLLVAGRNRRSLDLLTACGIHTTGAEDLEPASFDIVVECTGNAEGFEVARSALQPCGTLVLKSTYSGSLELNVSSLVVDEITVVGSRCGPFAPALALLAGGQVRVDDLIEARYSLRAGLEAFEHAGRPGSLKVLLEMGP